MAAFAIGEIIASECSAVVVTSGAALRASGREVLRCNRRAHLSALRKIGSNGVARIARESFSRVVFCVREA